jgi:hypothetical protein
MSLTSFIKSEKHANIDELKQKAIEALLVEHGCDYKDMESMLCSPYTTMKHDIYGWPLAGELDFPDAAQVKVYSSFDGFSIINGQIKLSLKEWTAEQPRNQRLFTDYDLLQMFAVGVTDAFFSLDHADPHKKFHPLQKVRFSPDSILGTEYLKTLFMTDYLLKMLTMDAEISSQAPNKVRSARQQLLAALPQELRDALTLRNNRAMKETAHRFWINTDNIEVNVEERTNSKKCVFGNVNITVKKHLLSYSSNGELVDAADDSDTSAEAVFAANMTRHYDELGEYFPEFARLKQLVKIAGAIQKLQLARANNLLRLNSYRESLNDNASWSDLESRILASQRINLQTTYNQFPPFHFTLNSPEVIAHYNSKHNEIYTEAFNQLRQLNIALAHLPHFNAQIDTAARDHVTANFTMQRILDSFNASGAQDKAQIRQQINSSLSHLNAYNSARLSSGLDALMNGDVTPLATLMTEKQVQDQKQDVMQTIAYHEGLDAEFNTYRLGDGMTSAPKTLLVPSVYHAKTKHRVYGGVNATIKFTQLSSVELGFRTAFDQHSKERAISNAQDFLRTNRSTGFDMRIFSIEQEIIRARHDLIFMDTNKHFRYFSNAPEINLDFALPEAQTVMHTWEAKKASKPAWQVDPYVPYRVQNIVQEQNNFINTVRASVDVSMESVVHYVSSIFSNTMNDFKRTNLDGQSQAKTLILNAAVLACMHMSLEPSAAENDDFALMREVVVLNPQLYNEAKKCLEQVLANIRDGRTPLDSVSNHLTHFPSELAEKIAAHFYDGNYFNFRPELQRSINNPNQALEPTKSAIVLNDNEESRSNWLAARPMLSQLFQAHSRRSLSAAATRGSVHSSNASSGGTNNASGGGGNSSDEDEPFAPGSLGAAKRWTVKARLGQQGLPTRGKAHFIPPEGYNANMPLPKGRLGGYIDRFGNEWIKGPSRTLGDTFEWDVQLSQTGKNYFAKFEKEFERNIIKNNSYVNISPRGEITH